MKILNRSQMYSLALIAFSLSALSLSALSLSACAGSSDQAAVSDEDFAELTSVMGQEANSSSNMPSSLGGQADVGSAVEEITLDKPNIELNSGTKWVVDECYTFVVGGIQKAGRDYSISGNYDGNRFKKQLADQIKKLKAQCPDAGESKAAIKSYFHPLAKYIKNLDSQAGVEESNKVVDYTKYYYELFEMSE